MKHLYFTIFLFSLFIYIPQARATTNVVFCKSDIFVSVQIHNDARFKDISCSDIISTFENAYLEVQAISPVDMHGVALAIFNQTIPKGASFSWVTSTLSYGLPDVTRLKEQLPTFYHEMGHKIFFEIMAPINPEIKERLPKLRKHVEFIKRCLQPAPLPLDCDTTSANQEIQKVNNSFSEDFDKFIYIITPYNELYADIVASIVAKNKNAIALTMDPCTESDYACEYRAFSKNTIDRFSGTNPYSRFSPMKRDIWDGWITPRLNKPQDLLLELGQIFVLEMTTNYVEDYKLIEGMSSLVEQKRLRELLKTPITESPSLKYSL